MNRKIILATLAAAIFFCASASAYTLFDEQFASNSSVNASWNIQDFSSYVWKPFVESPGVWDVQPDFGNLGFAYQVAAPTNWTELSSQPTRPLTVSTLFRSYPDPLGSTMAPFPVGFADPSVGTGLVGGLSSPQMHVWAALFVPTSGAGDVWGNFSRWDAINSANTYNISASRNPPFIANGDAHDIANFGAMGGDVLSNGSTTNWTTSVWSNGTECTTAFNVANASQTANFCGTYLLNYTGGSNPLQSANNFSVSIGWYGSSALDNSFHPHQVYRVTAYYGLPSAGPTPSNTTCTDGTAVGQCSTVSTPYSCTNTSSSNILVYNPDACACPSGMMTNGTTCVPATLQPKAQVPVTLITWGVGTCWNLLGQFCPAGGTDCVPSLSDCSYVTQNPFDSNIGTRVYAKYTATTANRIITTQSGVANSIRVPSVSCTVSSPLNPSLFTDGNMTFDPTSGLYVSANVGQFDTSLGQAPQYTVTCTSSIANSQVGATAYLKNVPPWETNVQPVAVAGQENALTDATSALSQLQDYSSVDSLTGVNRVTTQDSPIIFRYFTRPPVQSVVAGTLNAFNQALFKALTFGLGGIRSDPSTYSADACLLVFQNQTIFTTPGEVPWSGLASLTSAQKTDVLTGGATIYGRTVQNNVKVAGDYPYVFACQPGANVAQPGVTSVESLTVNRTCDGPTLTSTLKVEYLIGNSTQRNSSDTFYYGVTTNPVVTYQALNSTGPFLNSVGDCVLNVANASGTLATFFSGVTNSQSLLGPNIQNGQYVFSASYPYENGFLPVGDYNFTFTCNNRNKYFCSAPAYASQTIHVINTPALCLGTSDSCGITSCQTPCPDDTFKCEDGQYVTRTQACVSQQCVSRTFSNNLAGDSCNTQGHQVYTAKITFPQGTQTVCGGDMTVLGSVLKAGTLDTTVNGTCTLSAGTATGGLPVTISNGQVQASFKTGTGTTLLCGRSYTVSLACNSPSFLGGKYDAQNFDVGVDAKCSYKTGTVKVGCAFQTTQSDTDKGKLCLASGVVIDDPVTCGCPAGFTLGNQTVGNSTLSLTCVQASDSKTVSAWFDQFWSLGWMTGGLLFFIIFVAPFLLNIINGLMGRDRR